MCCIGAYEYVYVVGEAKITKIFVVYLQSSGIPSQSSEYGFEYCREQLGRYGISLSYTTPDVGVVFYLCMWAVIELLV